MKQVLIGLAIVVVFIVGMLASSSGVDTPMVSNANSLNAQTAQAVLANDELTRKAATQVALQQQATATAERQLTQNALSDDATRVAIAIVADNATSTAAQSTALTATAIVNGTPTAVSATRTAEVEGTRSSGTATAVVSYQEQQQLQRSVWDWGCVIVPLAIMIAVGITAVLQIRKVGEASAKRISVQAEADAEAKTIEANANAEEKYAKADEIRTKTARVNTERVGRTLLRHTADGNPVVMVELLPKEDATAQDQAEAAAEASPTIDTNKGDMDRYSPAQWRMIKFLEVCVDRNGKHSNVFPTAKVMAENGISRTRRGLRLKELGDLVRSRGGGETGGTWVVGYDTLWKLLQAVQKGEVSLPDFVEDPAESSGERG